MIEKNNQPVQVSLNGGVLIIGSLLWDVDKIRERWRDNFLDMKRKLPVAAPIRYGRVSSERKCTFTMVFSAECLAENLQGSGVCLSPLKSGHYFQKGLLLNPSHLGQLIGEDKPFR